MSDSLMCTVKRSSDKKQVGEKITLMGLTTTQPKAKFEIGVTSPLQKIFEFDYILIMLLSLRHQEIESDLTLQPDLHSSSVSVRPAVG